MLIKTIALDPDEYAAKRIGHLSDGRQFFLTTPFEPPTKSNEGCEFIALYLFDKHGQLLEAKIDSLGPRQLVDEDAARALIKQRLNELGDYKQERIVVSPFELERFGSKFGFVVRHPEEEGGSWAVEVQPGNYMAFFEPWDSGEYDT